MDNGMTVEDMEAAGQRAARIRVAQKDYREATEKLRLLTTHRDKKDVGWNSMWRTTITLRKAQSHYELDVTVSVLVPYGVVEQSLVDEVNRARREIILLGGQP